MKVGIANGFRKRGGVIGIWKLRADISACSVLVKHRTVACLLAICTAICTSLIICGGMWSILDSLELLHCPKHSPWTMQINSYKERHKSARGSAFYSTISKLINNCTDNQTTKHNLLTMNFQLGSILLLAAVAIAAPVSTSPCCR